MSNRIARGLIGTIAAAAVFSQAQAPTEFEVASIRPNTANDRIVTINVGPGGRFAARGYTLVLLTQRAYGVMDWNGLLHQACLHESPRVLCGRLYRSWCMCIVRKPKWGRSYPLTRPQSGDHHREPRK
jgi:hypothetical protein